MALALVVGSRQVLTSRQQGIPHVSNQTVCNYLHAEVRPTVRLGYYMVIVTHTVITDVIDDVITTTIQNKKDMVDEVK